MSTLVLGMGRNRHLDLVRHISLIVYLSSFNASRFGRNRMRGKSSTGSVALHIEH